MVISPHDDFRCPWSCARALASGAQCVLELFTFLRSGGSYSRIDVRPLDLDAAEAVALFDIRRANCFLSADRHALLAIVESSYGSFTLFNDACKKILLAKLGSGGGLHGGGSMGGGPAAPKLGSGGGHTQEEVAGDEMQLKHYSKGMASQQTPSKLFSKELPGIERVVV